MNRNKLIIISVTAVLCVVCGIAGYYAALSRVRDNYSSLSDNNTAKEDNINN